MTRGSTANVVVSSLLMGAVATLLTALTGTGAGGAYGFLFLGMLVLAIYWLWPDLRARFFGGHRGAKRKT